MNKLMLVNKTHPIDKSYIPEELVKIDTIGKHLDPNHQVTIIKEVNEAFNKLSNEAPVKMILDSSYRSFEYQQKILEDNIKKYGDKAYEKVALPGTSEHQTGLAVDYSFIVDGKYDDDVEKYPEFNKWIHANCHKFGFILRYPLGKEDITGYQYEPWHLRYVGEIAKDIYKSNLTLEEFLEKSSK